MAKIRRDQPLEPSILDRLLDEDPSVSRDVPKPRHQLLNELRQSVRRDLENLLNTRCRVGKLPDDLKELPKSLVDYGLPDFRAVDVQGADGRQRLRAMIERVIRTYEPRFKTVQVQVLDNSDRLDRTLRFRVDAMLHAEPAPEPVVFDSALEPSTSRFEVKGVER